MRHLSWHVSAERFGRLQSPSKLWFTAERSIQSLSGRETQWGGTGLYGTVVCSISCQITVYTQITVVCWRGLHITFTVLCRNIQDMLYIFTQILSVTCGFFLYHCIVSLGPSVGRIKSPTLFFCNLFSSAEGLLHHDGVTAVTFDPWATLLCKYIQICNIMCLCFQMSCNIPKLCVILCFIHILLKQKLELGWYNIIHAQQ